MIIISELLSQTESIDTLHAAGVSRRQSKMSKKFSKNVKIIELHYYIWPHRGKCSQISTNMPGIGLEMCEISRILRGKKTIFVCMVQTNGRVQSKLREIILQQFISPFQC